MTPHPHLWQLTQFIFLAKNLWQLTQVNAVIEDEYAVIGMRVLEYRNATFNATRYFFLHAILRPVQGFGRRHSSCSLAVFLRPRKDYSARYCTLTLRLASDSVTGYCVRLVDRHVLSPEAEPCTPQYTSLIQGVTGCSTSSYLCTACRPPLLGIVA